jgi:hypothetical protein
MLLRRYRGPQSDSPALTTKVSFSPIDNHGVNWKNHTDKKNGSDDIGAKEGRDAAKGEDQPRR